MVGRELSVILVHFATRKCLSAKPGTMLTKHAKTLAVNFLAWPTRMNSASLKTSQISNPGWGIETNPAMVHGHGVTRVCLCLQTGTAALRMTMAKVETVSCWILRKVNGKMHLAHRLMNTFARKRLKVRREKNKTFFYVISIMNMITKEEMFSMLREKSKKK